MGKEDGKKVMGKEDGKKMGNMGIPIFKMGFLSRNEDGKFLMYGFRKSRGAFAKVEVLLQK